MSIHLIHIYRLLLASLALLLFMGTNRTGNLRVGSLAATQVQAHDHDLDGDLKLPAIEIDSEAKQPSFEIIQTANNNNNNNEVSGSCGCSGAALGRDSAKTPILVDRDSEIEGDKGSQIANQCDTGASHAGNPQQIEAHKATNTIIKSKLVTIPGGKFYMGIDEPIIVPDGESPRRLVTVSTFALDAYEVSNWQFKQFVDDTHYVTESEKYGWSFVFIAAIPPHIRDSIQQAVLGAEWWLPVNGSSWREPEGPGTDVFAFNINNNNRGNHAVVHISWNDAVAYCQWRGARLPTEAEWEYAARGKKHLSRALFPWGSKLTPNNQHRANIFQGTFPDRNTAEDGYEFIAPVDAFGPQNDYGLYNMIGNAWEWVADWWVANHDLDDLINPQGPPRARGNNRVQKGGSFLCHQSYCYRYRVAARNKNTPDSATLNTGFRCAKSITPEDDETMQNS